jgi:hypothetical protein
MRNDKFENNNTIELPSSENSEGIKALVQQLITWKPDTRGKTDCVMAMWFAVIRCREFMQQSAFSARYANNRWATRSQREQRHTINLTDAMTEQWQENYG